MKDEIIRPNALVMGDIIEDIEMVDPSNHKEIISIGYLNNMETRGHLLKEY